MRLVDRYVQFANTGSPADVHKFVMTKILGQAERDGIIFIPHPGDSNLLVIRSVDEDDALGPAQEVYIPKTGETITVLGRISIERRAGMNGPRVPVMDAEKQRNWLEFHGRREGFEPKDVRMITKRRIFKNTNEKGTIVKDIADVVIHGTLTITDSDLFADRLAKGLGRNQTFGYGVLLTHPIS